MNDLYTPLSDEEFDWLDDFLLNRINEDIEYKEEDDEGVFDISGLDGFFTALVIGPVMVPPSEWLLYLWGDFEPEWVNEKEFEMVIGLLMRYMNSIVGVFEKIPNEFEPVFLTSNDGESLIVDEWCEGFYRVMELESEQWNKGGLDMQILTVPIIAFTEAGEFSGHDGFEEEGTVKLQNVITPNVIEIHKYWLQQRGDKSLVAKKTNIPKMGRNDPCFCGSGKKFKKCCLH